MQLFRITVLSFVLVFAPSISSKKTSRIGEKFRMHCFEAAKKFEGDIVLPKGLSDRNLLMDSRYKWKKGIVFYKIDGRFTKSEKDLIQDAMRDIENRTCIVFKPRGSEKDYVVIAPSIEGCWAHLGRIGGNQSLFLEKECMDFALILHELLHTLGCDHQHNAHNRDRYVNILWENVRPGGESDFRKCVICASYGFPYDYYSIMHFPSRAHTSNGYKTIETVDKSMQKIIGQQRKLSDIDIAKLNKMYKCRKRGTTRKYLASHAGTIVLEQFSLSCFVLLSTYFVSGTLPMMQSGGYCRNLVGYLRHS